MRSFILYREYLSANSSLRRVADVFFPLHYPDCLRGKKVYVWTQLRLLEIHQIVVYISKLVELDNISYI